MVVADSTQITLSGKTPSFIVRIDNKTYINNKKITFYRKAEIPASQYYEDFIMVGRGKITRPQLCGKYYGAYVCRCTKTRIGKKNYCLKMSCPICFHKATHRTAERTKIRMHKIYRKLRIRYKHYSFNTLYPIANLETYTIYKKKLLNILKKYGASGFLIFHPYRPEKLRYGYLRKSGHFHFIGFGNFPEKDGIPRGDIFQAEHGFNFTDISYKKYLKYLKGEKEGSNKPYIKTRLELYLTIRYLLTHSAYFGSKKKSYMWIGGLHPYYWTTKEERIKENITCKKCNNHLYLLINEFTLEPKGDKLEIHYEYPLKFDYDKYLIEIILLIRVDIKDFCSKHPKIKSNDINKLYSLEINNK